MNKQIQTEIDDITSILNHVESFTSCPHVKDAVPLLINSFSIFLTESVENACIK